MLLCLEAVLSGSQQVRVTLEAELPSETVDWGRGPLIIPFMQSHPAMCHLCDLYWPPLSCRPAAQLRPPAPLSWWLCTLCRAGHVSPWFLVVLFQDVTHSVPPQFQGPVSRKTSSMESSLQPTTWALPSCSLSETPPKTSE